MSVLYQCTIASGVNIRGCTLLQSIFFMNHWKLTGISTTIKQIICNNILKGILKGEHSVMTVAHAVKLECIVNILVKFALLDQPN